ncbi:MAG: phosphoribosylanthranilate isomerase [Myxococcota bacterium]
MRVGVKICGLTQVQDVEAAVEAGVDAIGFVFDRGPCRLELEAAPELMAPARGTGVSMVAVVGELPLEARLSIGKLGFDLLQVVDGAAPRVPAEPPHLVAFFDDDQLVGRVARFRAEHPSGEALPGSLLGTVNVDGHGGGGTGVRADWTRAQAVAKSGPITLSGGLRTDNLEHALRTVRPHAVDVSSGVERAPGRKDPARMQAFVAEVRRVEALIAEAA